MLKNKFQLCRQRHIRKQGTTEFPNGLCCRGFMHVKTGALVVAYFQALHATSLCAYLLSKIIVSCCHYTLLIPTVFTVGVSVITYILYQGAQHGDPRRLKIVVITFIIRLILLSGWLLTIMLVHLFNADGFPVFKDYLIERTVFIIISIIECTVSVFVVQKCYVFYSRLRIVTTRGQMREFDFSCCNFTPLVNRTYEFVQKGCCQKHGEVIANESALTEMCYYSLSSADFPEKRLPNTQIDINYVLSPTV
ncbi:hypothetical protein FO519_002355 [Halicephalobus sp. NKZ332]|nr:hypothetical protein FO519_002355 [Halicephalobus sp. NKZ332]